MASYDVRTDSKWLLLIHNYQKSFLISDKIYSMLSHGRLARTKGRSSS